MQRKSNDRAVRAGEVSKERSGEVSIQTSRDPVGAPIFFRDVPLISVPVGERGVIMPLPTEAVPLIAWRLRYLAEPKSRPKNAIVEGNLAAALIQAGRTDEAVEHVNKALQLDPEFDDAHNMLGIILARAGRLDEAVAHLEKAVAVTPDSAEYRFNLGRVLASRHSFAEAISHFEKAVELSGGQESQSLEMLAAMYSEVGRFPDAARIARRALDLAMRENNYTLAQTLRARVAYYESRTARP